MRFTSDNEDYRAWLKTLSGLSDESNDARGLMVSRLPNPAQDPDVDTLIMVFESDGHTKQSEAFYGKLAAFRARSDELDGHIASLVSLADMIQREEAILSPGQSYHNDGGTLSRSANGLAWTLSRPGLRELCFTLGEVIEPKAPSPAAPESEDDTIHVAQAAKTGEVKFNFMDSDPEGSPLSPPPAFPTSGGGTAEKASPSPDEELDPEEDFEEAVSTPEEPDADFEPEDIGAESVSDVDDPMDVDDESDNEEYISPGDAASDSSLDRAKTAQRRLQGPRPGSSRARPRSAGSTSTTNYKRPLKEVEDPQSGRSSVTESEAVETDDEAASSSDDSEDETPIQKYRTVPGHGPRAPTPEEIGSEEDAVGDEESDISEEL
jgi:hypothetical protein